MRYRANFNRFKCLCASGALASFVVSIAGCSHAKKPMAEPTTEPSVVAMAPTTAPSTGPATADAALLQQMKRRRVGEQPFDIDAATGSTGGPRLSLDVAMITRYFDENETAAESNCNGRRLRIVGHVAFVNKDDASQPFVLLTNNPAGNLDPKNVQCYFVDLHDNSAGIRKLKKGQDVVVEGECSGMVGLNVMLESCRLVEAGP